jgi:hypothetical protein
LQADRINGDTIVANMHAAIGTAMYVSKMGAADLCRANTERFVVLDIWRYGSTFVSADT